MKLQNIYMFIKKQCRSHIFRGIFLMILLFSSQLMMSQQDPGYTQYMYNTMSVNPGYTGSRGYLVINALARTQWVGLEGAPNTQTFSIHSPIGYKGIGLGLNIVNDGLGPSTERYIDGNISYSIRTGRDGNLSFGLKLGLRSFNVDWNKGVFDNSGDAIFGDNISKIFPTLGAGLYYYTDKFYIGLSVPNLISSDYYDKKKFVVAPLASERLHYFLIGGYIFDLGRSILFKPAFLTKVVSGSPISLDVSANFLFNERFTVGLSYRWDDSVSGLLGFRITNGLSIGYAYDLTTTNLGSYNSGTHEVMLRYEFLSKPGGISSPRFF